MNVCLIAILSGTTICHGDAPPVTPKIIHLESLPFVSSSGVVTNSPTQPGHYLGRPVTRGLQIGPSRYSVVVLSLGGGYDSLSGVVYAEDGKTSGGTFSMKGSSASSGSSSLFSASLTPGKQEPFTLSIKGMTSLTLSMGETGWFDVVADLTVGATVAQAPAGPQVIVRYPTGGAGVAAESKVLFAWQPFSHALNYVLQIWLLRQTGSTVINNTTTVTMTTLIYHATTYTWDNHGFLPGVYQYDLIPLDANGNALAARSNPQQITLAD